MPPRDSAMQYGMFVMPVHDPRKPLAQCYDEDLELAVRCDDWGFDEFWVGEHHSSTYENIVMPEIFIAKAFGMTNTIRMGPAPVCLQFHHPLHVASRLAFLDHLSHGRLNVCFGVGAIPTDAEMYDVDPKEAGARVAEAIDVILKVWTSDSPFRFRGEFWDLTVAAHVDPAMGLGMLHKPLQRPYPPLAIPCVNRNSYSMKLAAARGFAPFSHHMVSTETLRDHWSTYQAAAESAGLSPQRSAWKVSRNIYVAETTDEAKRAARENSLGRCLQYIVDLSQKHGPGLGMWKRNPEMPDAECNLDYLLDEVVIAGDPAEVTRRVVELREAIGGFGTLVLVAHDWDNRARWLKSLELFSREVVPAIDRSLGPGA